MLESELFAETAGKSPDILRRFRREGSFAGEAFRDTCPFTFRRHLASERATMFTHCLAYQAGTTLLFFWRQFAASFLESLAQ